MFGNDWGPYPEPVTPAAAITEDSDPQLEHYKEPRPAPTNRNPEGVRARAPAPACRSQSRHIRL